MPTRTNDPLDSDPLARLARRGLEAFARSSASADDAAPFAKYRLDPVGFARDVLGVEPWGRWLGMPADEASQVDILLAICAADWVAVRSGHKCGKSNSLAIVALWWVMTRAAARVTLTAPANHQIESIVWPEVRLLFNGAKKKLPGHLYDDCRSGLKLGDGWGIVGLSTDTSDRMSGKSGAAQLFLVDEAAGMDPEIMSAIFGNLAGGGKVVIAGNPTRLTGDFYSAFHANAGRWRTLHVSSLSTPNFHGGNVPGLAGPKWAEWALGEWGGEGNPIYDVRVLGRFASQGENVVIPLALIEAAHGRWAEMSDDDGPLDVGLDVARTGDDESILAPRRGRKLLEIEVVKIDRAPGALPPGPQVGEAAVRLCRRLKRAEDTYRPRVLIDSIGVGSAVVDFLIMNYSREIEVVPVNSGAGADEWLVVAPASEHGPPKMGPDEFCNKRAQLAFGLAKWLREGAIPEDGKLDAELCAPTFSYRGAGRLIVEDKLQIKKRLKRSPDRGDALALAVYDPPRFVAVDVDLAALNDFAGCPGVGTRISTRGFG